MAEATIVIDGTPLTQAQALTVRVALAAFRDRQLSEGLGQDATGIAIASAYVQRADEVLALIHESL